MLELIELSYPLAILACFLASLFPNLLKYGKTLDSACQSWYWIPKRWFIHFYIWSTALGLVCLLTSPSLVLFLFLLQVLRRLFECVAIHQTHSDSQIHILHYLVGIWFYTATPLLMKHNSETRGSLLWILPFFGAWMGQFWSHWQLALLRPSSKVRKYPFPHAFRIILFPHYFFEICLYTCLWGLTMKWSVGWIPLFTLCDLSISAWMQLKWYQKHYPKETKKRWAIVPGIF
jgi:3-oxo-5-alpha-steroid 4-dehydrogenase 3